MNRLTTDTPHGNFETMINFAYAKNGEVWLRGADDGKDAELCAYIAKSAFYLELCGITNKDDVIEACGAADCFCELGALFAAATQAAELRARLAAYEDTGLEPEEVERYAKAKKEGLLVVLPCGDDVTPIKCTGANCPMQNGVVEPKNCVAQSCPWRTTPMTNADRIRAMSDEELTELFVLVGLGMTPHNRIMRQTYKDCQEWWEWLDWLKQEVKDNA